MIRLRRDRSQAVIHHNFYGKRKEAFEKELLLEERRIKRGDIKKHNFKSDRWKLAKEQLFFETRDKCAYCEAPTKSTYHGDVDHYRPKSIYWWLAYCYDNYLVSCRICNQSKADHFPIQNGKMRGPAIRSNTTDAFIASKAGTIAPDPLNEAEVEELIRRHEQERPLLLNPYFDDPAEYFAWRADDVLKEIEVTPNSKNFQVEVIVNTENPDVELIAAASIEHYGLNRQTLRNDRYKTYYKYRIFRDTLEDDRIYLETRSINRNAVERMKTPGEPFAGMIRYFDALSPIPEN